MSTALASNLMPFTAPRSSRNPLTNAIVRPTQQNLQGAPKVRAVERPQVPEKFSPPLPRQSNKAVPPSPPKTICDKINAVNYLRVGFLGEGGFARVYEIRDIEGIRLACKVVTKDSLKTKKAKTKLYAEIKIHRSLSHPNVVHFYDCFEDDLNVYMTLELCPTGSVMDMLRNRQRFTEPESRFFMVQLLGACHYMHTHQVIHRDLKLGNLLLDKDMNIKVGDFGLAALIEREGERKKTICGTPNYIAPEVLFDTANGHSFEVDTWSVGVILYTLLIGRPPFQTKEVKSIYKRIRDNQYDFPVDRNISSNAQLLIQEILTPNPQERPTVNRIIDHAFFTLGIVPPHLPRSAYEAAPNFRHITRGASTANLAELKSRVGLIGESSGAQLVNMGKSADSKTVSRSTIAQQEREFQRAVQPGSPISVLLSSARQPFMMAGGAVREKGSQLFKKLANAGREQGLNGVNGAEEGTRLNTSPEKVKEIKKERDAGRKRLESQKARIVAQMVPVYSGEDQENVPPTLEEKVINVGRGRYRNRLLDLGLGLPPPIVPPKLNAFESAYLTLSSAFSAFSAGRFFRDLHEDGNLSEERVFVVSWVDYCNKYGMGYALTDGSVGVHFNDTTTLVLSANKLHFDYVTSRQAGTVYVRKSYTVTAFPDELKSKVHLLKHFERYIMDRLYGDHKWCFKAMDKQKGMVFVQKYLRMKHVILFKMSHDCLQFNFNDHTKIILSCSGLHITHIDKSYNLTRWKLSELIADSLSLDSSSPGMDPTKFRQRLLDKLKYCKEVLGGIKSATAEGAEEPAIMPR